MAYLNLAENIDPSVGLVIDERFFEEVGIDDIDQARRFILWFAKKYEDFTIKTLTPRVRKNIALAARRRDKAVQNKRAR